MSRRSTTLPRRDCTNIQGRQGREIALWVLSVGGKRCRGRKSSRAPQLRSRNSATGVRVSARPAATRSATLPKRPRSRCAVAFERPSQGLAGINRLHRHPTLGAIWEVAVPDASYFRELARRRCALAKVVTEPEVGGERLSSGVYSGTSAERQIRSPVGT